MTDESGVAPPDDGEPTDDSGPDDRPSALGEALGRLKRDDPDADDANVSNDGRSRMSWSSVTEAEPDAPEPPLTSVPTPIAE